MTLCEACEVELASVVEPCDDQQTPYRLCSSCHSRLQARALRPLEWYNLVKRHGHQFLLHDDFYTDDGMADQPIGDVVEPERFPVPILSDVSGDPDALLDYSLTRWSLDEETFIAWSQLPISGVLSTLTTRFAETINEGVRSKILKICASCAGEAAADFVTYAWGDYPEHCDLMSLAEASASCLSFEDGFGRVLQALAAMPDEQAKRDAMLCLGYFSSPRTLDWIERCIYFPITESWGYLAASSVIDWKRIKDWLAAGRPLSLVAIDALCAIQRMPTPFLKKRGATLSSPPTFEELKQVLEVYVKQDSVPRVSQRVVAILANPSRITRDG